MNVYYGLTCIGVIITIVNMARYKKTRNSKFVIFFLTIALIWLKYGRILKLTVICVACFSLLVHDYYQAKWVRQDIIHHLAGNVHCDMKG